MACTGDGWHKVNNLKVLVQDRVIVDCMKQDPNGNWIQTYIQRWNKDYHWYQRCGKVTLAAFRSGYRNGTYSVH